jgi:hypothetical protein
VPQPRRSLPAGRPEIPWAELRRRSTIVFVWLQAGWTSLSSDEREDIRRLLVKSRGRPRNLSKDEARRLGRLAGKAAAAAAASKRPR